MGRGRGIVHGRGTAQDGIRCARASVVTLGKVVWTQTLNQGTSAQSAELLALTQALHWGKYKAITVYIDSQYACATAYVRGLRKQDSRLSHLDGDPRTNGACQNLGYPD